MAKILIHCKKCGKEIKLALSDDSRALCRKCRKNPLVHDERTTRFFDF